MRKLRDHLTLPQRSRANPVKWHSTHIKWHAIIQHRYRAAKTHRKPHLCRSLYANRPYTLRLMYGKRPAKKDILWASATLHHTDIHTCCSALQCVAGRCRALQCLAFARTYPALKGHPHMLQCIAVCCSVLQCAAVCCSVLWCVVVCCSVLQCAVCRIHTCMHFTRICM